MPFEIEKKNVQTATAEFVINITAKIVYNYTTVMVSIGYYDLFFRPFACHFKRFQLYTAGGMKNNSGDA